MNAQAKILDAKQNTEEWLAERKKYIGSSDAPAALGMSRYKSPVDVAIDKRTARTSDQHPEPDTPAQHRGHVLEPVVASLFERQTGLQVSETPARVHPEHDWMAASCDRIVEGEDAILECKTHVCWTRDQYGEDGTDGDRPRIGGAPRWPDGFRGVQGQTR